MSTDFFYEHTDGSVHRKPFRVVDMGGGPLDYFDSPFVKRWWQGEYRCKRCGYTIADEQIHMDHHICEAAGGAPMPKMLPQR